MPDSGVPLTFFLAGFSKCGTSTLAALLGSHPDVALPRPTEPWFYCSDEYPAGQERYRSLFPDDLDAFVAIGDDSTRYSSHAHAERACERILAAHPDAKFLFIARDPVARIESSYRQVHDLGRRYGFYPPFPLHEAMEHSPAILLDANYWRCMRPYRERVHPDRLRVVFMEDLIDDHRPVLEGVFGFIGVDPARAATIGGAHENSSEQKHYDTTILRRLWRRAWFREPIKRLPWETQDRLLAAVGLRRRFSRAHRVEWTDDAIRMVRGHLLEDTTSFIAAHGEPRRGWTRFRELTAPTLS